MTRLDRRTALRCSASAPARARCIGDIAFAQAKDSVTIGWPSDVPSWDPNQRFTPDAQPIFKLVFDQPLDQNEKLDLIPKLITKWELAADGQSMAVELRDDVTFHNGDKMTAEDFRYTFFERIKAGHKVDTANSWRKVTDIEIAVADQGDDEVQLAGADRAAMARLPRQLHRAEGIHGEGSAPDAFREKPVGTGPYKLVEYQLNSRIVLERNDSYWGPKPKLKRVTFDIIKDPSARVAAIQSGQVDLTINVPVREVERLKREPNARRRDQPDHARDPAAGAQRSRLRRPERAARRASRDRQGGAVEAPSTAAPRCRCRWWRRPARPGYLPDFKFEYSPEKAKAEYLAKSGFSAGEAGARSASPPPTATSRATTTSRARSSRCGSSVGIEAELEVIEYAKYFELNRGAKLPEATLYSWDNATGDPEIFAGYLLNPKMPFSAWKGMEVGEKVLELFNVADYDKRIAGYRELNRSAVEAGATIPLLQSVHDGGAQEEPELRQVRQRLDSRQHDGVDVTCIPHASARAAQASSARPPRKRGPSAFGRILDSRFRGNERLRV